MTPLAKARLASYLRSGVGWYVHVGNSLCALCDDYTVVIIGRAPRKKGRESALEAVRRCGRFTTAHAWCWKCGLKYDHEIALRGRPFKPTPEIEDICRALPAELTAVTRQLTGTPQVHRAYVYRDNKAVWSCSHNHRHRRTAEACAQAKRDRMLGDLA